MVCQGEFVYIVAPALYRAYLEKGFYKYIPKKLLTRYQQSIKPRKICEYIDRRDSEVKGYGIGVFISYENISKEDYISRITYGINFTKTDDTTDIILDEAYKLNESEYNEIESQCGLKIFNGRIKIVDSITDCIKKICTIRKSELKEQEILIISDDTEDTKKIVLELSSEINFLTIIGNDKEHISELEKLVLLETGLSIHSTGNVNRTLSKFDFIIFMRDSMDVDINKIRKKTIVIDASPYKKISRLIANKRKDLLVINDFIFSNSDNIFSMPEGFNFGREVSSHIFEALNCQYKKEFIKISVNNKKYSLNSALRLYTGKNRNMSVFRGK